MTPPTDSLVAAFWAVPTLHEICCSARRPTATTDICGCYPLPDYPACAAAAREWMRKQLPMKRTSSPKETRNELWEDGGYNTALADVARRLGL